MAKLWEDLREQGPVKIKPGVFAARKNGCLRVEVESLTKDGLPVKIGSAANASWNLCSESAETLAGFFAECAAYLKSLGR